MFEQARELYESGMTQTEVATELGTTQKVIRSLFKRNGHKSRVAKKRNQYGENNAYWGGKTGEVGYAANHLRVERLRGKPNAFADRAAAEKAAKKIKAIFGIDEEVK